MYLKRATALSLILIICSISNLNAGESEKVNITGKVTDENGEPVAEAVVTFYPMIADRSKTDENGKFSLTKKQKKSSFYEDLPYIMVRHRERNLVTAEPLPDDTENLQINLSPGIILSGKVVDPNGKGIRKAEIGFGLRPYMSGHCYDEPVEIDEQGNFEIKAAPPDINCVYYGAADGFGHVFADFHTSGKPGDRVQLDPLILPFANLTVSGIVVDVNDKPVAGAHVFTGGPEIVQTDENGKFILKKICAGTVNIIAEKHSTSLRGQVKTAGGAKDVKIIIYKRGTGNQTVTKQPLPLVGKPLPDMNSMISDFSPEQTKDRAMLICFWDMGQRPSRNCILQLSKRAQELKAKDIVIVAVQDSKIEQQKLDDWIKENDIAFPVGMIQTDEKETLFNWGVKSLPWLILTDSAHIVRAEGFAISELDTLINEKSSSRKMTDSNQVTGIVKNPQGRVMAGVKVTEFQTDKEYTTNKQGEFTSAYGPSDERRFFFVIDQQNKLVGVGRLAARGRNVEIKLAPARMVSGTVVDPEGKPVAGAQVAPVSLTCFHVLTDKQGKFDVGWDPKWADDLKAFFLMARHLNRNLAGGIEISTETENIQIELEPALTLTGTIEDPDSKPIADAKVGVSLIIGGGGAGTPVREVITDKSGRFEIPTLLQKQEYGIGANADGYWRNAIKTGIINKTTNREDIGTIILKQPNLFVSGIVVDGGGKPVANIPVYLWGDGQPDLDSKTDEQGKFKFEKVCSGPVQISAKNQSSFGIIDTQGGAENVKIIASPRFEPKTNTP